MTKTDLTQDLARVLQATKKDARWVLDIVLDSMIRAIQKGERVELRGFGSFNFHTRRARRGRNPVTGARVDVPAKTVLQFRPSKELKAAINAAITEKSVNSSQGSQN